MAGILQFLLVTLAFAWIARALLGARELTWTRTVIGAIIGLTAGAVVAAYVLAGDLASFDEIDSGELAALAYPLSLVATMGALVVMEAFYASRRKRGFSPLRPFRSIPRWFGMWARGLEVSRILVRNGLGPLVGLRRGGDSPRSVAGIARAVRQSLEQAGGMFVKLGQLLATRPDLLPEDAIAELSKLHADVAPLPAETVASIIEESTGRPLDDTFSEFVESPLGSASIGQVHAARLTDGREVVVKVRRPGLQKQVDRDLAIVRWLARIAERRTSWGASYGIRPLVAEFSAALREELHFGKEATSAKEMAEAVSGFESIVVPAVVEDLSSDQMLIMERLKGAPLSTLPISEGHRALADQLCHSQVEAMLQGKRFHGDPHQGNVLLLDDGRLGLVDFGNTSRLDTFERAAVFEMLVGLRLEDPVVVYDGLRTLGAVTVDQDPDKAERALAQFLSEHGGSGMPSPEALVDLIRLTTRLGMHLPPSTSTMFRALATLSGTLESLSRDYPLLEVVAEIGGAELRRRGTPESVTEFVQQEWAELGPLFRRAPKHLDRIATQLEHGGLSGNVRLFAETQDVAVLERLVNRALTAFLSVGLGAVSVVLLTQDPVAESATELSFFAVLGWAGLALAVILLLRVLLEVFRSDSLQDRPA